MKSPVVSSGKQPPMVLGEVGLDQFVAEAAPEIVPSFMEGGGKCCPRWPAVWSAFSAPPPPPGKPVESQPQIKLSL